MKVCKDFNITSFEAPFEIPHSTMLSAQVVAPIIIPNQLTATVARIQKNLNFCSRMLCRMSGMWLVAVQLLQPSNRLVFTNSQHFPSIWDQNNIPAETRPLPTGDGVVVNLTLGALKGVRSADTANHCGRESLPLCLLTLLCRFFS